MENNSNIIIIRSVYKITRAFMEPAIDPKTGRFPLHVRKVDSNGERILSNQDMDNMDYLIGINEFIEIFDGKSFDLDDPYDSAWWEAIKYSPSIAKDRWARDQKGVLVIDGDTAKYGSATFYVERPGQQTKTKNNIKRDIHEAKAYIYDDSAEGLYQKAKLLKSPMAGLPLSDVEDFLVGIAEKTPDRIKDLYVGKDVHLRILLLDALDKRVIRYKDSLYIYGEDIFMGATEDFVIHWFKDPKNKRFLESIKKETYPEYYEAKEETQEEMAAEAELAEVTPTPLVKPTLVKRNGK